MAMLFIHKIPTRILSITAVVHDIAVAALIWYFAFLLRFNFEIPAQFHTSLTSALPVVVLVETICFFVFGLYRGLWRFASLPDLKRIIRAVLLAALIIGFASLLLQPNIIIPRSVLILNPLLLILAMGGSRFAYRAWKERRMFNLTAKEGKPLIVIGVEDMAISLIKELNKSADWQVVAMVDPEGTLVGRALGHTSVEGDLDDLPQLAHRYQSLHCMVAMPNAPHQMRRKIVEVARKIDGMEVLTMPAMADLMSGRVGISQIRKIQVEDLLGRDVVHLDKQGLGQLLANQVVMVTGAGGSIGSELCRQILAFCPKKLLCVDISEYALYQLQQEFERLNVDTQLLYLVADVKNNTRMLQLLLSHQPKVVLHAAGYKHVPMMENQNVTEALINNAYGTYQLAAACITAQVEKFVLISTDKAVNPTNVMGASKRLAELICQSIQPKPGKKGVYTQFITVRFGNVLGSSGSVIPKFREQIANGGPITITHPEITRYFMSIPEAAQLVLQAGAMGKGGEIFVLDMGEPVKILDLAKDMIKLSGLDEDDIRIEFTGLRAGEKLYEELLADDENTLPTLHEKLRIAQARTVHYSWLDKVLTWLDSVPNLSEMQIKAQIGEWVEEYQPESDGVRLTSIITQMGSQTIH